MNHLCYSVGNCSLTEGMNCAREQDFVILDERCGYGVDETPGWFSQLLSLAALWCMRVAGSQVYLFQDGAGSRCLCIASQPLFCWAQSNGIRQKEARWPGLVQTSDTTSIYIPYFHLLLSAFSILSQHEGTSTIIYFFAGSGPCMYPSPAQRHSHRGFL